MADLILRLEPTDVKRFNAFQNRFGSQWLNVIPCKNLRLKLSNQQLRIAIGLRLGSKICEWHKCVCGKDVTEEDGWHEVSCLKSAGRFSRHSNLNALIKQRLSSTRIPSVLEPRHLYRTDQKRPDGLTLVPWAVGKQLLWDVTVVHSLAPCRINAGSVCNPGTAAAEAEELCQSVISGSLTFRNTKIRGFGMEFYFSKIRMEPVMLSFLATTENIKYKIRTTELTIAGK